MARWCWEISSPAGLRGVKLLAHCIPTLGCAGILGSQPADGGPIEMFAALRKETQETIMQQTSQRHGHAETLGRGQRQADVFVAKRRGEGRRLELALGYQAAVNLVRRCVEYRGGQNLNIRALVDAGLADERDGLAQRLDGGRQQKVSAEFDEIRRRRLRADRKCLLSHGAEQRLTLFERRGVSRGDNEQLGGRRNVRASEDGRSRITLSG